MLAALAFVFTTGAGATCIPNNTWYLHANCYPSCSSGPCPREANGSNGNTCLQMALPLANGDACQPAGGTACWVLHNSDANYCQSVYGNSIFADLAFSNNTGSTDTITVTVGAGVGPCPSGAVAVGTATVVPNAGVCIRICPAMSGDFTVPANQLIYVSIQTLGFAQLCFEDVPASVGCGQAACDSHICLIPQTCTATPTMTATRTATVTRTFTVTPTSTPTYVCPPFPMRYLHAQTIAATCAAPVYRMDILNPAAGSMVPLPCIPTPGSACELLFVDLATSNVMLAAGTFPVNAFLTASVNGYLTCEVGRWDFTCGFTSGSIGSVNYGAGSCVPVNVWVSFGSNFLIPCNSYLALKMSSSGTGGNNADFCVEGNLNGPGSVSSLCVPVFLSPSCTFTVTPTPTRTATDTNTATETDTASPTGTPTASGTLTASATVTATKTPSVTPTATRTMSGTPSPTHTSTQRATASGTATATASATIVFNGITVIPNPVLGHARFVFRAPAAGKLTIRIWSFSGLAAAEETFDVPDAGVSSFVMNLSPLARGVFFYQGVFEGGAQSFRTSVQKLERR